ncbi:hypothetical protein PPL_11795 [Heterostelium album PN500]|uniref:PQ-loop repeat-containing protein n=1 Tax=Heterostelium pallidum (strain ATCC 26659 / Pp 5 / PN500) TaxID=670386 RepID=D3BUH5_HETP5|nr:hypothetical protein PPL_11795 [Heterostelium album PN500]EFA74763.1 hypothetical protein PPL_11795 [Heterostelium album PN500]|eukprot:XP_020426897.1 hypothetical protein PPL_11795 [Heterostelium album PN500]
MSSFGFCVNGSSPDTSTEYNDILVHMNGLSIALGVGLIIGGVISTLPQHYKILKSKSASGLSYLWLFLGNVNQFSACVNAFMLKYPQIDACTKLGFMKCGPSMLALIQLVALWMFTFPIYILYIIFTPNDLKRINATGGDIVWARREYRFGKIFFGLLIIFLMVIPATMAGLLYQYGPCKHPSYIFGYTMGIVSTIVTFIQWSPQIYKTWRQKSGGTLSITMLWIQGPGTVITIYFLVFVSQESVSTWLSYVSAALQIFILLIMLIYYKHKNRDNQEIVTIVNEPNDLIDEDPSASSASFTNYIAAHEDSQPLLKKKQVTYG